MTRDELGHLEHTDLGLAIEDSLQLVVGIDLGLHLRILQFVLLNVDPQFLGKLRAREGGRADDSSELSVRCDRFHERGVGFASGFFSHSNFLIRVLSIESNAFIEGESPVCLGEFCKS